MLFRSSESSLDFAKDHLTNYFSSDFFPKPIEFEALWSNWSEVKEKLLSKNIRKHEVGAHITATSHRPKGNFRIVHELDPLDSLVYTSLVCSVSEAVERCRMNKDDMIACSYRISLKNGGFFCSGNGFNDFLTKSEYYAVNRNCVLVTDISDYYNQIYMHRIRNAIEVVDKDYGEIAGDIEYFLMQINSGTSQGIPVGPAASVVLAEAIMIDVDRFLSDLGVKHARYVDDFRIFSDSMKELVDVLEKLTRYLYHNHRLSLSSEKTELYSGSAFLDTILNNHYEIEKQEMFKSLHVLNPYSGEQEEVFLPRSLDRDFVIHTLRSVVDQIERKNLLDIGLARGFLRKARHYKVREFSEYVITHLYKYAPVINDVCLYLDEITDDNFIEINKTALKRALRYRESGVFLVAEWLG